ncbi:glutathione S-transferase [Enterovibrio norvegicus FF-33]|uniref:Glutathione S-transferase n=1 Tax=Enterovibrio norvegicus FF-454 TaxID=1185651 RepID=A0A1E5CFF9_9GAMM|nr:glutathione S-transferase [Enterovibrio norvegicus]OEE64260.1 glutathione S-transferase [Enterovibrio norvegicus FF-454]OEE66464.1 glutathione S-transferase [Enterovibrio norvegicus FF-33]OEE89868.1 glutathione S-transferase [Enterovibrio norvegicus FF-162]
MLSENRITLFETTGFPNPARIRAAIAEKSALNDVDFVEIDVMNLEHRTDQFYAMNPMGTVPVLRTAEGEFISESTAITEYIDAFFAGPSLTGTTPLERGLIHMMQRRAESMVLDAVATYFHHATQGLGPLIEKYQCSEWGNHQKQTALSGLSYFNEHLNEHSFVAADTFSMADITLFYGLAFAEFSGLNIPAELTSLIAWREEMAKRPCFSNQ